MSTTYYIGYTNNAEDRYKASSGGIGTALIRFLLSTGNYRNAISFTFDRENCQYKPIIIHCADQLNVCGSVYQDIDIARFIRENINDIIGGIVVTCPPCQVTPIRLLLEKRRVKSFIISYCCSGQTKIEGTYKLYEYLGIKKDDVVNMRYRGYGWPSGIQIETKSGKTIFRANYTEPWKTIHQSWLFRPQRCFYCKFDTGKHAEISLADPWLEYFKNNDVVGHTMIIVNNDVGKKTLDSMVRKKLITIMPSSEKEYNRAQWNNIRKKDFVEKHHTLLKFFSKTSTLRWYVELMSYSEKTLKINNYLRIKMINISNRFIKIRQQNKKL